MMARTAGMSGFAILQAFDEPALIAEAARGVFQMALILPLRSLLFSSGGRVLSSSASAEWDKILRYVFDEYASTRNAASCLAETALVAIEPQVFDLLVHLVRYRDRVVSKDDLLASVWQGASSRVRLCDRINAARNVIGDSGGTTAHQDAAAQGLRFVGAVREKHGCCHGSSAQSSERFLRETVDRGAAICQPWPAIRSRIISRTGLSRTSPPRCRAIAPSSSSPATRRSPTRTRRSIPSRSRASWASVTCSKAACASERAGACHRTVDRGGIGHHLWADRFDGDMTGHL